MSCLVDRSDDTGGKFCMSEEFSGFEFLHGGDANSVSLQEQTLLLQYGQL